jgi:ABC-2 type transport system ATP-binding protein
VFGFLGPNGAGKTTAMRMLLGLTKPTSGRATILGSPAGSIAAKLHVGFLPEQFRFHEWMTAGEFLHMHAMLARMPRRARQQRVGDALELVGLASRRDDRLRSFSKGMLQRIGIAQAVVHEPDVVLLDEPTSALDPIGRRDVREIIRTLKARGTTVFLNSHLLSEVESVCDRVLIIDKGQVARLASMSDVLSRDITVEVRAEPITPDLLRAISLVGSVIQHDASSIEVSLPSRDRIPLLAALITESGRRLYRLAERVESLEDLFVATVRESGDR